MTRGRPPRATARSETELRLRVTEAELAVYRAEAADACRTLSDWVRDVLGGWVREHGRTSSRAALDRIERREGEDPDPP